MHKDHGEKVYTLVAINEDHCLLLHQPLFGGKDEIQVPFSEVKAWKKTKKEPPQLATPQFVLAKLAMKGGALLLDYNKSYVQSLLLEAYFDNLPCQKLQFSLNPSGVYTSGKVKKAELLLYPAGMLHLVKPEDLQKSKHIHMTFDNMHFAIVPYKGISSFKDDEKGMFIPWNWVQVTEDEDEANMVIKMTNFKGIQIPVLTNTDQLVADTLLCRLKDGIIVQPKKKAKKGTQ